MQYLQKNREDEVDFLPANKHESFLQIDSLAWVARHAQSTQNNRFAISLHYLKENVKDEVDFLSAVNIKGFFKFILLF